MHNFFLTAASVILLVLPAATAASGVDFDNIDPCPLGGASCLASTDDAPGVLISTFIEGPRGVQVIFIGLMFGSMIFLALKMLFGSRDENNVTEARMGIVHIVIGTMLVSGAFLFADSFTREDPATVSDIVLNSNAGYNAVLTNFIILIKALVALAITVNLVIQGFRLITSNEESVKDSARKRFVHGMIGAGGVLLANSIMVGFYGINIAVVSGEIIGLARFMATLFGSLAIISMIVAGMMLVISADEALKDKAKKMIITSVIAVAVVISSYALVTLFIKAPL